MMTSSLHSPIHICRFSIPFSVWDSCFLGVCHSRCIIIFYHEEVVLCCLPLNKPLSIKNDCWLKRGMGVEESISNWETCVIQQFSMSIINPKSVSPLFVSFFCSQNVLFIIKTITCFWMCPLNIISDRLQHAKRHICAFIHICLFGQQIQEYNL